MWSINNVWSEGAKCLRENRYTIFTRLKINCRSRNVELWTSVIAKNIITFFVKIARCAQGTETCVWRKIHNNCTNFLPFLSFVVKRTIIVVVCLIAFCFPYSLGTQRFLHKYLHSAGGFPSSVYYVLYEKQHAKDAAKKFLQLSNKIPWETSLPWVFLNYFHFPGLQKYSPGKEFIITKNVLNAQLALIKIPLRKQCESSQTCLRCTLYFCYKTKLNKMLD